MYYQRTNFVKYKPRKTNISRVVIFTISVRWRNGWLEVARRREGRGIGRVYRTRCLLPTIMARAFH